MAIVITCHCGRTLRAKDEQAGRACRCPGCGRALKVPYPVATPIQPPVPLAMQNPDHPASALQAALHVHRARAVEQPPVASEASATSGAMAGATPMNGVQRIERTWRGNVYWLLLLMIVPLVHATLLRGPSHIEEIKRILDEHPELKEQEVHSVEEAIDKILEKVPGHRITGAFLARDSQAHWLFAAVASIIFFGIVCVAIPTDDEASPAQLLGVGVFTATIGIALLLTFQYFHLCFCLVGIWYVAALDPRAPFGASLLGFILGVGVAEEITKVIPVLWRIHKDDIDWRGCCLVGMASGAAFGVAEGVHYCMMFYNGISPASEYLVRFTSIASLHVMLSGACGIMIFHKRKHLGSWIGFYDWVLTMTALMIVPILLHGLYDALLKQHLDGAALGVWLATFAWLAWLITSSRNNEIQQTRKAIEGTSKIVRTEKGTRFVGS